LAGELPAWCCLRFAMLCFVFTAAAAANAAAAAAAGRVWGSCVLLKLQGEGGSSVTRGCCFDVSCSEISHGFWRARLMMDGLRVQ
jgi:hypothetical protein